MAGHPSLPSRAARLLRGHPDSPRWERPALIGLLAATAVLYLWGLGASGWGNAFYAAAAQAGSQSWKALFYGSSDAANSITVDKPPASLWVMGLSARVFGVNAWSILVPQALMGVASVGLLYAAVRRSLGSADGLLAGPAAGLLAGVVLALTPIATLMFRFDNPDALLVLLLVAAAYAVLRAQETASTRWLVLAGALVGFGFLTKMLQALLVVPAFAAVYLATAPTTPWRRVRQLLASGLALVASAGWYIAVVELVPESSRPYIGGSQNNSILELAFGYNGLGRITGDEVGSAGGIGSGSVGAAPGGALTFGGPGGGGPVVVGPGAGPGGGPGGGMWGETGWLRMFDGESGGQVAWLLPAALALFVAGVWATRRGVRTDRSRAAFGVWGGWLLVTAAVFSFMQGIYHAYYTVALAPAIGALVGMGTVTLWRLRRHWAASAALATVVAGTAVWSYVLLNRTPEWNPWLRPVVIVTGVAAAAMLAAGGRGRVPARVGIVAAAAGIIAVLLGPAAYATATAVESHTGAIPSAGPAGAGGFGGPGGGPGRLRLFGAPPAGAAFPGGPFPGGAFPGGGPGGGPGGTFSAPGNGSTAAGDPGMPPFGGLTGQNGPAGRLGGVGGGGGPGGLLDAADPGDRIVALLEADADSYTWVAASIGSNTAAGYQLATGKPVMPIGGFNGSDPSPTLEQFQQYVEDGRIHYFIGGGRDLGGPVGPGSTGGPGGIGQNGGSSYSEQISEWVQENFTATTVDGVTVYDLTSHTASIPA